jgi:hypothetical protein
MTVPAIPPAVSLASAANAVGEPAQAQLPLTPAPAAPVTPPVPQVSVTEFEANKQALIQANAQIKAMADKQTRIDKALNLLTGKTDENTASLPPEIAQQLHTAKTTAERAWRTLHAQTIATQLKAVSPEDVAALVHQSPEFAVDAEGRLLNQPAAVSFLSNWKTQRAYAFTQEQAVIAAAAGAPGVGARPPAPPAPSTQVPVRPAPKSAAELYHMPFAELKEYNKQKAAAGGIQST